MNKKYINKSGSYKINVKGLNENDRRQLLYSIIYLGLYKNYDWCNMIIRNINAYLDKSTGYWYIYKQNITTSHVDELGYFERHGNIEIIPEEILIKDIVFVNIGRVPMGMFIRVVHDYSCIKFKRGYLKCNKLDDGFVNTYEMSLYNEDGLYSRSLNHVMVNTFFKG